MIGYLQRLVDSAAPLAHGGAPVLRPVVRSASPVFAEDQLSGLEPPGEPEPPVAPARSAEVSVAPARVAPATGEPLDPEARDAGTPDFPTALETGWIAPPPPSARFVAEPAPSVPGTEFPQEASPEVETAEQVPPIVPEATVPVPRPEPLEPAESVEPEGVLPFAAEQLEAGPMPAAEMADDRPRRAALRTIPVTVKVAPTISEPSAESLDVVAPSDTSRPQPAPDATAPRARPVAAPAPRLVPQRRDPGAVAAEVLEEATAPPAPRIEIGRVIVEMPSVAQAPRAEPKPLHPLTAEAASQIGPIGDLRALRHLFALRRA